MISVLSLRPSHQVNNNRTSGGFTLIELLIALVLSLILIGGVTLLFISTRAALLETQRLQNELSGLRFIGSYLVEDLRMAGYDYLPPLSYATATTGGGLQIRYGQALTDCTLQPTGSLADPDANPPVTDASWPGEAGVAWNTYALSQGTLTCTGKRGNTVTLLDGLETLAIELIDQGGVVLGARVCFSLGSRSNPSGGDCSGHEYGIRVGFRNAIIDTAAK